ncbi:hypothetical protein RKD22_000462 [Streptomyces pristinaespiralis]
MRALWRRGPASTVPDRGRPRGPASTGRAGVDRAGPQSAARDCWRAQPLMTVPAGRPRPPPPAGPASPMPDAIGHAGPLALGPTLPEPGLRLPRPALLAGPASPMPDAIGHAGPLASGPRSPNPGSACRARRCWPSRRVDRARRRLPARRPPCRTRSAAQGRWPSGPRSPNPAPPAAPAADDRPSGSTAPATACRPGVPHAGRDRPRRAVGPRAHAPRTRRRLPRPALLAVRPMFPVPGAGAAYRPPSFLPVPL